MKSRLRPMKWFGRLALIATAFSPVAIIADDAAGKALLRRKRITTEIKPSEMATQSHAQPDNVADLWEQEAAQAEMDAERILQGYFSMSITDAPGPPTPPGPPTNPGAPVAPTPAPTDGPPMFCLEGTTREDYLLDLLSPITDRTLLRDPTTPQGMSFNWLVNMDPLLQPDPCNYPTTEQRYGLATLFYSTTGMSWTNSSGWLGSESECTWAGVVCGDSTPASRKLQASPGRVYKLNLPFNNLAGTIPEEIVTLYELENLNIFANSINSTLPDSLGTLTRLIFLDAERNLLSGQLIPNSLLQLGNLQALRLSRNSFTGSIPPQIGQIPEQFYQLTNLEDLRLDGNYLSGSLSPAIGQLTRLNDLRLNENLLTGTLPNELSLLTDLKNLILFDNYLNESLPDVFGGYVQMEQLDLSLNFLTGNIPESIFAIPSVKFVYLSNNSFIGPIPSNFQDPPLLRDLYLDGNYLTGTIPPVEPGRLQELNEILFNYNLFSGAMPQSFCDLRLDAVLDDLFADCGGETPKLQCSYPDCCNRCFTGDRPPRRRARQIRS
ncbi:leucine Rich Repeat [Seminavis robusta]|uniref:Leucine Rich Repeat n=1 Tax=Seminavis robusta TaxID=568900 RepID=A0A9N8HH68_9STRA|nr:leucine Rich Repeat [Seminavis robusta]|eukprot:Sro546_g164020.1 leucine Rich Repeat (550) ;mRNA; f:16766-18684